VHCVYVGVVVQSQEALKLTKVSRDNARRHEVTERAQKQVDSFTRQVERRLSEKMELTAENKEAYIRALQHRCHQHVRTPTWCLFRGSDSTGAALTQPASVSALLSAGGRISAETRRPTYVPYSTAATSTYVRLPTHTRASLLFSSGVVKSSII